MLVLLLCLGVSPYANATSDSLALWDVVADIRELHTVTYSITLPFLFVLEQVRMDGF